jgi:hypothetical protein
MSETLKERRRAAKSFVERMEAVFPELFPGGRAMSETAGEHRRVLSFVEAMEAVFPGLREEVLMALHAMRDQPHGSNLKLTNWQALYIAERLIPIMEAEKAAKKGRRSVPQAGEMVQAR